MRTLHLLANLNRSGKSANERRKESSLEGNSSLAKVHLGRKVFFGKSLPWHFRGVVSPLPWSVLVSELCGLIVTPVQQLINNCRFNVDKADVSCALMNSRHDAKNDSKF